MAKYKPECVLPVGLHFAIKPDSYLFQTCNSSLDFFPFAEASFTGELLSNVKRAIMYMYIL